MKKFSLLLAALLMTVTASAQSWSSEWVPKHEFHIDVFGGISSLNYSVNPGFAPNATNPLFPDRLGGGAGLGYTLHFNEYWGLSTGAEFAIYRGVFTASNNPWIFYGQYTDPTGAPTLMGVRIANVERDNTTFTTTLTDDKITMKENQTLYTVQVPLMVQFMAPINAKKSNHFYLALGARFLFNIAGQYKHSFSGMLEPWTTMTGGPDRPYSNTDWTMSLILANNQMNDVTIYGPRQNVLTPEEVREALSGSNYEYMTVAVNLRDASWADLTGNAAASPQESLTGQGKFKPELFNVAGSAELGFRWGFGNGTGLYTGLYLDYGFMSPLAAPDTDFMTVENNPNQGAPIISFADGPIVAKRYDDVTYTVTNGSSVPDPTGAGPNINLSNIRVDITKANVATKLAHFGAGLKLKLAFGKVKQKPVEPQIIYVDKIIRDTVVKTNTVTVRDTVVKTNTVIEKEIIRDTITIIKEVPVEIKQTMAELSNTMFDYDKSVIKEEAKGPLNKVVAWLQENPNVKVEISGHTDSKGSDSYNQKLSEARAKAVYDYFVSQGVDKFRLAYAGYGESRPIATNETDAGRQLNRRVELNIIQ